eukprot:9334420-Pyramimonas_sp.AAC.1
MVGISRVPRALDGWDLNRPVRISRVRLGSEPFFPRLGGTRLTALMWNAPLGRRHSSKTRSTTRALSTRCLAISSITTIAATM